MTESRQIGDGRDWARKIMTRHSYGQKVGSYALRCAHEALGIPEQERQHRLRIDAHGRVVRDPDEGRQRVA